MKTEPIGAMGERVKKLFEITADDVTAIEANARRNEIIALAAFKKGQSSPKIKQLEWDVKELSSAIVECRSKTPIGDYRITHLSSVCLFDLWGSGHSDYSPFVRFGEFDTYEEAKAAAQADFEKRIKKCLL